MRFFVEDGDDTRVVVVVVVVVVFFALLFSLRDFFLAMFSSLFSSSNHHHLRRGVFGVWRGAMSGFASVEWGDALLAAGVRGYSRVLNANDARYHHHHQVHEVLL